MSEKMTEAEIISFLEMRLADAIRSKSHTEQWYAERIERLKDLCKQHNIWSEAASIIANGSLMSEPPTYAQQLNAFRHRAEAVEEALAALVKEVNVLKESATQIGYFYEHKNLVWRLREADRALSWWKKEQTVPVEPQVVVEQQAAAEPPQE
jgi:uncharacterized protein (UPF0335 family)